MKITNWVFLVLWLSAAPLQSAIMKHAEQKVAAAVSIGYISGTAHEYVYLAEGALLSHLLWNMEQAPIIRAEGTFPLNSWLEAGLSGWINLDQGEALMDDYDWEPPISVFSKWSHHPDTDLRQANEVDIHLKGWFLQKEHWSLAGMVGYKRSLYSFLAKGGCFNYDFGLNVGCFPEGEVGIGYKQTYTLPYLGIAGMYSLRSWVIQSAFKYSNWVEGRDKDQHYQTYFTFYEGSNHFKYYEASVNAGYFVTSRVKVFAEGIYNLIPNKKMGTVVVDNLVNERFDIEGPVAGFSNNNYILSLGIQYLA